ncbi:hypothetical protein A7Q26_17540 [Sphingobium sp. TCM1]|nr:hypothetical protein A7Q26_17540 [Sphingobium sp. TCM1]
MDFHGSIGNLQATRNHLVRLAVDQATQNVDLAGGEIAAGDAHAPIFRNRARLRLRQRFSDLGRQHLLTKGRQSQSARQRTAGDLLDDIAVHRSGHEGARDILHTIFVGHDDDTAIGIACANLLASRQPFIDVGCIDDDYRALVNPMIQINRS